jgi:hypothetical protein
LGTISLALAISNFGFGIDGFGLDLSVSMLSFVVVWASSPFFLASSPILAFGLAMVGLPSFLASWTKVDVKTSP